MKQELKDLLAEYLGELMYKQDHTVEWGERIDLAKKREAVNILLEIEAKPRRIDLLKHLGFS